MTLKSFSWKTGALAAALLAATACTGDFDEMNTNPNGAVEVSPDVLLPFAIETSVDRWWGHRSRNERLNIDGGMLWIQHLTRNIYSREGDNYNVQPSVNINTWSGFYNDGLMNFQRIITLTEAGAKYENANYEGMALTMRSWVFAILTDTYGPIPYQEALRGTTSDPVFSPAYDEMPTIYQGLIADLGRANELLTVGGASARAGDIMFGGDVMRWKKFANALRIKLLNRAAHKLPDAGATMTAMLADPDKYPLFTSPNDFAQLKNTATLPSNNEWNQIFRQDGRTDWNMSSTLINKLKELKDPRLPVYANPNADGAYQGHANGLPDGIATVYLSTSSVVGDYFTRPDAPSVLMSHAELLFALAEAALENDISGDAGTYLRQAVQASFDQYGVSAPEGYLDALTADKETIMTQKWLALFGEGIEAWTEYRRTGFPVLPPPDPRSIFLNDGVVPTRIVYPSTEYSLNQAQLDKGITLLGEDNMRAPLWWMEK